jgi:molybdate transport system substrate-binding protein
MGAHRQAVRRESGSVTFTKTLDILSAGAAKAVVLALADELSKREGGDVSGVFDAAGAIRAQFIAGAACDVLILPAAMQDELAAQQRIEPQTRAPLGGVPPGIAIAEGATPPSIGDADALRAAFEDASALYCPDTERSTAGIHFVRMLREMGIHSRVAPRIRDYANGAQAMAALAASDTLRERSIGCTQATEILYTPGVALIGLLPPPFELTTVYTAAVSARSRDAERARQFVARLTDRDSEALRAASGFMQR